MNKLIILIIAILPVYLLCLYVYNKDHDKESKKLLAKLLLCGMLSCIPAFILEIMAANFFGPEESMNIITLFIYVVIGIALVEEGCKWFIARWVAFDNKEFDHIYDGIVYCVFVSLGFALLENILYVLTSGIGTGLLRAISSVPAHACFAIIMGEYFSLAKIASTNGNKTLANRHIIMSIIMPSIAHGIYDYCIFTGHIIFIILFLILLISFYIYSFKKIKKLSNIENKFIDREV